MLWFCIPANAIITAAINRMSTTNFFDLQVNGYGGVDFNSDDLSADWLHTACVALERDGVGGVLATIITEHLPVMIARLNRLVALRAADDLARKMIVGLHVEGPFLNETPGYRGAHPADAIRPANLSDAKALVDSGDGLVRLVTLAPERDEGHCVTAWLAAKGIAVSAGHCDPTWEQLQGAIDSGLSLFTHLGNGCPMQLPRHDNIIQRALALSDRLTCCFIADGVHVPLFALKNYIRSVGVDRCCVVTDAMAAAGLGPGRYRLSRWEVVVDEDLAARAPDGSHLVGSAMTMPRNLASLKKMGLSDIDCEKLLAINPRRAIGAGT
jgi:N-acetylglucosamine-6-phosphate deacetylase